MFSGFDLEAWTASDAPAAHNLSSAPAPRPAPREGDWECHSCRNINFAKRSRCNKCNLPKKLNESENAKVEAGDEVSHWNGPAGLFKKGDWSCSHCRNVNWARRNKCNVCFASKPSTTDEPRTGRAGGHYDLQDPYDRQQHHSDDEDFDEFGRKKKKKKTGNAANASAETYSSNKSAKPTDEQTQGRSMSMSSKSSRSSDYTEDPDYFADE